MEKLGNVEIIDAADALTFGGTFLQRAVGYCVYLFERVMPDPFVLVSLLTVITALAAFLFAP